MRALIEAQIEAMRVGDWSGAFGLATPELQAQYGSAVAFRDDVMAHYGPLPAVVRTTFLDMVLFRGLPTYRVVLGGGQGESALAYYLVRRLDDRTLRIAGCVLVQMPSS